MAKEAKSKIIQRSMFVGIGAFFLALLVSSISQGIMEQISSATIASLILLVIVVFGIVFDLIGTAVTAADEEVFHAMATKRVPGGQQGAYLVRNADRVANICNDVVGDVSASISGALGAGVALLISKGNADNLFVEIIILGMVAGLTVGGKAYGKTFAIQNSNDIIFMVAKILDKMNLNFAIKRKK